MDRLLFFGLGVGATLSLLALILLLRRLGPQNKEGETSLESLARQAAKALRDWAKAMARTSQGPEYAIYCAAMAMYDEAQALLVHQRDLDFCRTLFNRFIFAWNNHASLSEELLANYQRVQESVRKRRDRLELLDREAEKVVRAGVPVPLENLLREVRQCVEDFTKADENATETYESAIYLFWLRLYDEMETALALNRNRVALRKLVGKLILLCRERVAVGKLLLECMTCYKSPMLMPAEATVLLDMQVEALLRAELLTESVPLLDDVKRQFLTNLAYALVPLPAEHAGSKVLLTIEPEIKPFKRPRVKKMQAAAL